MKDIVQRILSSKIFKTIGYFFNNKQKITAAYIMLFAFVLSMGDIAIFFYESPSYDELQISEGKIFIGAPDRRTGNPLFLIKNSNRTQFTCAIVSGVGDNCLPSTFEGKQGKIWWVESYSFGFRKSKLVFQIKVDGELVLNYQDQVAFYQDRKKRYFPSNLLASILILIFFIKLQFKSKAL
jgi:hypothetical protein